MHPEPGPSDRCPARNRHFNPTSPGIQQLVESRGGTMRQDGPLSARERSGHPAPFDWNVSASHRVHAVVHSMQPSTRDAIAYGTSTEAEIKELKEGEDPVLSGGNAGDQPVEMALGSTMDGFRRHRRRFRTIVGHGAIVATQTSRVVDVCA